MNEIGQFFVKVWEVLKALPIIGPLLRLLYSRKAMIAAALTAAILRYVPQLAEVEPEVNVVVLQVVGLVIVWVATSLGYALEDYAEKSGGSVVPLAAQEIREVNVNQPQAAPQRVSVPSPGSVG